MSKVALVTGSARGIGRAIAIKFASNGFDVIINYSGSDDAANETLEICRSYNTNPMIYKCDVSSFEDTLKMVNEIIGKYGKIDVLVNNAGITKDCLLMRMTEDDFSKVIDVNLKGTFNCIKHVSKYMMKAKSGKIINMASVVGLSGNAGQANYAASKAGVIALTKSTAKELASRGINVNAVAPGYIKTDMTDKLSDEVKEGILNMIPLKRYGNVEDVSEVVFFLASDSSNYVTGQVINVCGGMAI